MSREIAGLIAMAIGLGLVGAVLVVLVTDQNWIAAGMLGGGVVLAWSGRRLAVYDPVRAGRRRQERARRRLLERSGLTGSDVDRTPATD